jgi:16S rRNA (adenine1518-N6/adenine1519-N6)-dimethyltransferase
VDSAILAVRDISYDRFKKLDPQWFFTILHAGFGSRRKQLAGSLKKVATKESIDEAFKTLELSEKIRGEDISIDNWILLAQKLVPLST